MEMKKNRFQLILILSGCGCILLAAFLAAFAFHRPATVVQEPEEVPSDPVLIEQESIDIINMETVSATPDPSILSSLPPFAVTLISGKSALFMMESEPEMQEMLWTYLKSHAAAPEGERFYSASFSSPMLIGPPNAVAELLSREEALSLLDGSPLLVPIQTVSERISYREEDFSIQSSEEKALPKGSRLIRQLGTPEYDRVIERITYVAGTETAVSDPILDPLSERHDTLVSIGSYSHANESGTPAKDEGIRGRDGGPGFSLRMPLQGTISSYFGFRNGKMHNGIDISANAGTDVVAPEEGVIVFRGIRGSYGMTVDIDHGNGFLSRLSHLQNVTLDLNQRIFDGEKIGELAPSENEAVSPYLHFELLIDQIPYNPRFYLPALPES